MYNLISFIFKLKHKNLNVYINVEQKPLWTYLITWVEASFSVFSCNPWIHSIEKNMYVLSSYTYLNIYIYTVCLCKWTKG